jgi:hypothetical protein
MKDDATNKGVSEENQIGEELPIEEVQEVETKELTDREKIFAQATKRRMDELAEEGVVIEKESDLPVAAEAEEVENDVTVEVKIDGQTSQVSADQINERLGTEGEVTPERVKEYQKHLTADKRLEDAASQRKDNERRAQELATKEAELAVLRATPAGESAKDLDPELVGKLGEAFLVEDSAEATKILTQIIKNSVGPAQAAPKPITQAEIARAADNAIAAREYKKDLAAGQAEVKARYSHLLGDPALEAAINTKSAEIFNQDKSKSPKEILLEAAEAVHKTILKAAGVKTKTDIEKKLEQKRGAAAHTLTVKTSKIAEGPKTETPKTRQQVVADMVAERSAMLSGRI